MRTHHHDDFDLDDLLAAKTGAGLSVSLVLPARDEEATVGSVVGASLPLRDAGLVDELVVVDSLSTDATARMATDAGATVVSVADIGPDLPARAGKGEAMWRGLLATTGDVVVYCDTDVLDPRAHFVLGLAGPLLTDPGVHLVKGFYRRPIVDESGAVAEHGGRVTELTARPLLGLTRPDLASVVQPLAGEWAGRRSLLESIPFPTGYGVEIAVLLDAHRLVGTEGLAQVDLGVRTHTHHSQQRLGVMAAEVMAAALPRIGLADVSGREMRQYDPGDHSPILTPINAEERPPAATMV